MDVAFVPLDDRPCTRDFVLRLAPLAGFRLHLPPAPLQGSCTMAGQPEALLAWLESAPPACLVSVDMLVFGGLVASRSAEASAEEVAARLRRLEARIEAARKSASFRVAFSIVMRVPPYLTSDSERQFSEKLSAWSQAVARSQAGTSTIAAFRRRSLEKAIPESFRTRYLQTRARNHEVNRRALEWARDGLLDFVLLGMDDSRTDGLNVQERRQLEPTLAEPGLADRAALIPGADELGQLLLARQALQLSGRRPAVWVRTSPDDLARRITRYEDRPVGRLLDAHLGVLGLRRVNRPEEADLHLFVHGPSRGQQEASVQVLPPRVTRRVRAFADEVAAGVESGAVVAVADLGYANGADRALVRALADVVDLPALGAFAAWNTAGNTVGTVLSHAVLRWLSLRHPLPDTDPRKAATAHARFLLERFLDDWAYQSEVRVQAGVQCALKQLNVYALGSHHEKIEALVRERLQAQASDFFRRHFEGRHVSCGGGKSLPIEGPLRLGVRLPWPRIFEVALEPVFDLARG